MNSNDVKIILDNLRRDLEYFEELDLEELEGREFKISIKTRYDNFSIRPQELIYIQEENVIYIDNAFHKFYLDFEDIISIRWD